MKNSDVLLDSDVVIWCLRGKQEIIKKLKKLSQNAAIHTTSISVAEIWAGSRSGEEDKIESVFKTFPVLSIDENIGKLAGKFLKQFAKSHNLEIADALIGAIAADQKLKLWTLNKKHYPMLKKNQLI